MPQPMPNITKPDFTKPNFISVVVPAHNVQGYLDECLDSLLRQQQTGGADVIGVDDASPDHCGVVLDERAAIEPRLTVVHLEANAGPGPARNAGLARATGEYVWFVDGDDRVVPGALAAIEAKLREIKPDVLVVGTARENWKRTVRPWRTPGTAVSGAEALTRWPPTLGALVVRRQFLLDAGIEFRTGWYEDIAFAYAVLARAETTATFTPACYIRRFDREPSLRTTRSPRHADAVAQWDYALSLPVVSAAAPKVRRRALDRAVTELLKIMEDERRVPRGGRRAFFAELSALVRKHAASAGGRRQRLIAADSYAAYRAFSAASRGLAGARTAVRNAPASVKGAARRRFLSWYYRWQLRRPIDENLAVYAAYWYRGYACNPAAVFEKAKELAPHVRGVWVVKPERRKSLPKGVPSVTPGSRAYLRAIARAKYLVNNATFPPDVVKRPGSVHVQTHHGTPLKTMGLDQPKYPASTVGYNAERLRRNIAKWDFSVTANRHTTLLWERQFPIKGETLETGYPRNDRLAVATPADVAAARAELGIEPDERVVVYAPTHREWHATFTPVLDVDALAEALGPQTRILLRGHYFYDGVGFPPQHPRVVDVSSFGSVETLYLAADVLITDYSSVMFDYAVLDKPLVIFAPDWEVYTAVRGVTFDLAAHPPGVFARTFDDLVEAFRTGAVDDEAAAEARGRFRERFCALEDGHAAERVVRRVFLKENLPITADRRVHLDA
ncbi:bifunctional glycosyltransferase/CDP-glycerol:glycerophosphate glycerophosphotransferase [Mangrovihabitans endophyticus]|uniref:Glycosyl transferase n=1 Tax=Mangrovihabitans endophyticus TaxID=1751298 RepID=A0A8J3C2M9_9ACTN|nr:bifunctional glycosyltransferase family 2 protein/CDP-glycerol:glycerophosphate glycerophosphotransferase [Mangrovihabitans endophyticus]GGL08732.1 glycosyl transferase [Mangrovihabitans endophyticus]